MSVPLAHVVELWRYPVKGMRGESVRALEAVTDGITQDRRYAFESSGAAAGKPMLTGQERAAMLLFSARVGEDDVWISAPDGQRFRVGDPLLVKHMEAHLPQNNRMALRHSDAAGPFTDVRPIAVLSTETVARAQAGYGSPVDTRRFRANVLLRFTPDALQELTGGDPRAFPEDALTGRVLKVGERCRLRVLERVPRCRMVTLDPTTARPDPALMKYLDRHHSGRLGVYAAVDQTGLLRVGETVVLA